MIQVYVDDILVFSRESKAAKSELLGKLCELKPESVKLPEIFLGANIKNIQLPDGRSEWWMSSRTYVKNAVKCIEALLHKDGNNS